MAEMSVVGPRTTYHGRTQANSRATLVLRARDLLREKDAPAGTYLATAKGMTVSVPWEGRADASR